MGLTTVPVGSTDLTLLGADCFSATSCFFEFAISVSKDLLVSTAHLVQWCYVADCTMEPHLVVVPHIAPNQANGIVH